MALILAAGLGSRLGAQTKTPKPLTRVLGLTLAERVVCTLIDADIRRCLVTLGHEAETVRAHFSGIARRRCVTIEGCIEVAQPHNKCNVRITLSKIRLGKLIG